jgi:hypothetical protein
VLVDFHRDERAATDGRWAEHPCESPSTPRVLKGYSRGTPRGLRRTADGPNTHVKARQPRGSHRCAPRTHAPFRPPPPNGRTDDSRPPSRGAAIRWAGPAVLPVGNREGGVLKGYSRGTHRVLKGTHGGVLREGAGWASGPFPVRFAAAVRAGPCGQVLARMCVCGGRDGRRRATC